MVGFLQGQLEYFQDKGFEVTVVSPAGKQLAELAQGEGLRVIELPMARKIAPVRDLLSLVRLWRLVRALCPTVTNVGTPKAGLLGGFAAWVNRVPCRFYTLRGLRFETTKGLKRRLLVYAERLACRFAHRVICVSKSVREKAVAAGITSPEQTVVFGSGSSNGVDASRFAPTPEMMRRAAVLRCELGIPPHAPVVGFVGRLTRDKGVPELMVAFLRLSVQFPDLRLLLLGRFEDEDPLPVATRRHLETHPNVILVGHQLGKLSMGLHHRQLVPVGGQYRKRLRPQNQQPSAGRVTRLDQRANERRLANQGGEDWPVEFELTAPYYALMDVFVLPTHREGLPNVVLEAQAAGRPVVAARATGVVDVIVNGETGLLFPVGDASALADALARLLTDKELAKDLGRAGQERVKCEFRQEQIWEALYQEYVGFLQARDLMGPLTQMSNGSCSLQDEVAEI